MIWVNHHANKISRAAHLNHVWVGLDYSKTNQLEQMISPLPDFQDLGSRLYTTFTNFSMKYLVMCKVCTDVGGIK